MFGSHLSIAGGMTNALAEAQQLKMDCVQVFTKNQQQWRVPELTDDAREVWLSLLRDMKWDQPDSRSSQPIRTVSHNSYLINLASPDKAMWEKSLNLQRVELERCEALHIPVCVSHPGAHLGQTRKPGEPNDLNASPNKDELAGLKRIVKALDRIHSDLPGYRTVTALETTVGSGTNLGYAFHHLGFIKAGVNQQERVGYCMDTCHITAAGYDMTTDAKADAVMRNWKKTLGFSDLHVIHINDSVGAVGSRRDRHAHIGDGECGKSCFRAIVNHPSLARVPKILETPKGKTEKGLSWDVMNIRRLKRLIHKPVSSR